VSVGCLPRTLPARLSNPDATIFEVLGTQTIIPSNRPTLAAGLPYSLIAKSNTFKALPSNLRHHFKFSLYANEMDRILDEPALNLSQSLPDIAGKHLTLSFEPASDSDRQVIESYLPEIPEGQELDPNDLPTSLPGYLIKLKAQLKLDGEIVAESGSFTMGQELSSTTGITRMTGGWHSANNKPIAGEFYAFGIDLQGISAKQLESVKTRMETVKTKLETQQFEGLTKDGIIGDLLYAGALSYFAANDLNLKMLNKGSPALAYRQPSAGTFSTSLDPIYSFGVPRQVKMSGIRVDMDAVAQSLWAKNNDVQIANTIGSQVGMMTSAWEHRIPEMLFTNEENPGEAVSAVKALAIANAEGQRIYQVTSENVNAVLPVLNISSEVKDEIRASVAVGKVATVSQNNITVGSWTGVGYIIADPETGAGAYRISGGENGGYVVGLAIGFGAGMFILGSMVELSSTGGAALPLLAPLLEALIIVMTGALIYIMVLSALSDNPSMVAGCFLSGFLLGLDLALILGPRALKEGWQQLVAILLALIDTVALVNFSSSLPSPGQCLE